VVETAGSFKKKSLWHLLKKTKQKVEKIDKKFKPKYFCKETSYADSENTF
jgi:hypothetical protein